MPARQRSNSALEEKLIDSYVQSTVDLKANVSFVEEKNLTGENLGASVVLVGPLEELNNSSVASLPFYSAAVAEGIKRLEEGKSTTLLSELSGTGKYIPVVLCAVSKKASRNNCPYRPECYGAAVKAGISAAPGKDARTVSVFVRAPAEGDLAIAAAIARCGPHSFSEASDASKNSFLNQKVKIQVAFEAHRASFEELERLATSVQLCQRLVDTPTDILDTVVFAEIAEAYGAALGASVKVIRGEELREQGYGGIYSVGKCAEYGPALVTLHFSNPKAVNGKNVALVGKGLVYDCGGLSLKIPTTVMCNMKTDMGGAGAVLAGFVAVVRAIKAGVKSYEHIGNLSVTLCMADNAIGPRAYRNDDILRMKSGKTVEVANTDAEGRICLGDGVFHATNEQSFVPDVLIDMATLTGAQGIATGQRHAAIYSNNAEEERKFVEAGRLGGDTCFPVLYCPEYHEEEFKSVHADMRNIMKANTNASVSCAGYFVESHISTKFTGAHIHVDLAYPSSNPEGATGYGVSLVTEYLKTISH